MPRQTAPLKRDCAGQSHDQTPTPILQTVSAKSPRHTPPASPANVLPDALANFPIEQHQRGIHPPRHRLAGRQDQLAQVRHRRFRVWLGGRNCVGGCLFRFHVSRLSRLCRRLGTMSRSGLLLCRVLVNGRDTIATMCAPHPGSARVTCGFISESGRFPIAAAPGRAALRRVVFVPE